MSSLRRTMTQKAPASSPHTDRYVDDHPLMLKGCTWALSDMLLMTKKTGNPTPAHTFAICSASRKSLVSSKKTMIAATVPSVAIAIHANVVTNMGMKTSLLMLCMAMNQERPHPNIIPNIIRRSSCRVSRLPLASLTSRSSSGPLIARRMARKADTMPHPPVNASFFSAYRLDTFASGSNTKRKEDTMTSGNTTAQ